MFVKSLFFSLEKLFVVESELYNSDIMDIYIDTTAKNILGFGFHTVNIYQTIS